MAAFDYPDGLERDPLEELLEARHEKRLQWEEPWPACGPRGNTLDAHVSLQATVHDCVNMVRLLAKTRGRPTMGRDREFLEEFIGIHFAHEVKSQT